ncbi:hypothetical protein FNW02_16740 [Komarekiella sp. 'clone 1']|uniref:Uncharacterized protein n=1 Tax=Komarekiella delphini-convector SJRDD-AB1 TaxID=2593771 RepID=A0AA40VRR4_9NOST|nr:hypothetical protein [Komarekiella delphini-convector]MBD6617430.1 hypothetical protein [Komarekiella delphini-convector SJRDD-AB1]
MTPVRTNKKLALGWRNFWQVAWETPLALGDGSPSPSASAPCKILQTTLGPCDGFFNAHCHKPDRDTSNV